MISIPKGTKDVLPQDSYKWQYLEKQAREVARLYGAKEIRTPVFEHTELFARGVGDTTDVVNKEMYTFLDKGERSITLKPEGTAGVARAYIENALDNSALPVKMYYFTPVFRYEKPQAGRLREHHQFGVELYGSASPSMDVEAIDLANTFLTRVGVTGLQLYINSIGCAACREKYNQALRAYFRQHLDQMCDTCKTRLEKNPLRILDCKNPTCHEIASGAPVITDYLCEDCQSHMAQVEVGLRELNIDYQINPHIVRGLDYYTRTVFEFVTTAIGAQGTVCGGGRYDRLVESVGGKPTPAVGFGLGLERLQLVLDACGVVIEDPGTLDVYVATAGEGTQSFARLLTRDLRKVGIAADCDRMGRSLKAQFKYAGRLNARYVITVGEEELRLGEVELKDMAASTQSRVSAADVAQLILDSLQK